MRGSPLSHLILAFEILNLKARHVSPNDSNHAHAINEFNLLTQPSEQDEKDSFIRRNVSVRQPIFNL